MASNTTSEIFESIGNPRLIGVRNSPGKQPRKGSGLWNSISYEEVRPRGHGGKVPRREVIPDKRNSGLGKPLAFYTRCHFT